MQRVVLRTLVGDCVSRFGTSNPRTVTAYPYWICRSQPCVSTWFNRKKALTVIHRLRYFPADPRNALAVALYCRESMFGVQTKLLCQITSNCVNFWRYAMNRIKGACLAVLATIAFLPCNAFGQAVYGSIYGTVTDATGALIPNAPVVVTDTSKGTTVTVNANESGEFRIDHLIPDSYSVTVDQPGFKKYEQNNIQVNADSSDNVQVVLSVGTAGEVVTVNADTVPQLKTDRADVAVTYSAQDLETLPIPDHNFTNLQLLLPGAVQLGWAHAASENPQGSKQIQIDGQAFGGVNYTLDGTDNQDAILGIIVINPNSDSMTEAKMATQNFDAEFGKAVASVQTVQTKSGTNEFHGTLFDNRESAANLARDPFSQSNRAIPIPQALKNQFGGSIGGPIIKDKLFFFGDYQGVRQKVGYSTVQTVPTAQLVSSCLSGNGCNFSQYVGKGQNHVTP